MEELDLLKKDWKKNENSFQQVSESEINAMTHKSSSSIVKWILLVSILEFLIWATLSYCTNSDIYNDMEHEGISTFFRIYDYVNYAIIFSFIVLFYRNYKNISVSDSTRDLMDSILKTHRTVKYYIWYNLTMIGIAIAIGFVVGLLYNPEMVLLKEKISHSNQLMALIILLIVFSIAFFITIFWLIYRLAYGTLLRKLHRNYVELRQNQL
jgi:hypothetical protein